MDTEYLAILRSNGHHILANHLEMAWDEQEKVWAEYLACDGYEETRNLYHIWQNKTTVFSALNQVAYDICCDVHWNIKA